ncbi:MAG: DUF4389 domain-containing protein [Acidobacteriota bacterium]
MPAEIQIDLPYPTQLSRAHLLVRLLVAIVVGGLTRGIGGWPGGILYLALPAIAAILISQHGAVRYLGSDAPKIVRVLDWILGFLAYMTLLTDEFPGKQPRVRYDFVPSGSPTVGSAVLRIFTSIPAAIVIGLLGIVAGFIAFLQMVWVLFVGHYPRSWFEFQCGMLRIQARLYAYHASLTETYPTFSFHTTLPAARISAV